MNDYVGELSDIVGDDVMGDDVMGDEMGYEVGARRRRAAPSRAASPSPSPSPSGRQLPGLVGQERVLSGTPSVGRRQIAPIPFTTVAALSTVDIELRPQRPIRIERLVLDGAVVAGLFLQDILIGAEPQFVNAGSVPFSTFQPQAFGTDLRGNTAQPGIAVTLRVFNSTAGALSFGGALIGTSLT